MSRDQGPTDKTLTTGNGGNTVTEGAPLPPRKRKPTELPAPTNGGNWSLFETTGDWLMAVGAVALVFTICAAALIRFFKP